MSEIIVKYNKDEATVKKTPDTVSRERALIPKQVIRRGKKPKNSVDNRFMDRY